jgi:hypothetical protein
MVRKQLACRLLRLDRAPGDERGKGRGGRAGEHCGPRACCGSGSSVVADSGSDGRQRRSAEGCADLTAGVDHAPDHALLSSRNSGRGDHHGAERRPGRAEADQHHRGQQRAVMAAGRQLSEDDKSSRRDSAREHKYPADADATSQPRPERASCKADDALRRDGQPSGKRGVPEHLLEIQREDNHLAAVP